ncbi:DnaB-like helicase C-terminal domain-containing protein [Streptococcus equi]|uniref:DnaB-like helicase C-terminal domain-containing protein n=1 Tax=Streptococcus equi TaxID=1336 RepID=UPI001E3DFCEA|nr:DnaB-like helicase C-terminal domain-containing protein [Streptococcus equi]
MTRLQQVYTPDQLIILAARPAVGKTAFVLNICSKCWYKQKRAVAIFLLRKWELKPC